MISTHRVALAFLFAAAAALTSACSRAVPTPEPAASTYRVEEEVLEIDAASERVAVARVTPVFFREPAQVSALIGRTFAREEFQPANAAVAMLSYRFWNRRFKGVPTVIGQRVRLAGRPVTIVGVLPQKFPYPADAAMLVPDVQR